MTESNDAFVQHLAEVLEQLREILRLQDREIASMSAKITSVQVSLEKAVDVLQGGNVSLVTRMRLAEEMLERISTIEAEARKGKNQLYVAAIPGVLAMIGQALSFLFHK